MKELRVQLSLSVVTITTVPYSDGNNWCCNTSERAIVTRALSLALCRHPGTAHSFERAGSHRKERRPTLAVPLSSFNDFPQGSGSTLMGPLAPGVAH